MSDRYEELSEAVILRAHEDYINALIMENKAIKMLFEAKKMKADVLSFYGKDWYYSLTNLDPAVLIETAKKQADYIIWQKARGCGTCKLKNCPHNIARENWKSWAKGNNRCLKIGGKVSE